MLLRHATLAVSTALKSAWRLILPPPLSAAMAVLFYGGDIHQIVPLGIDDDAGKQMQVFFVLGFFIIWGFVLSNIFTGQVRSTAPGCCIMQKCRA